MNNKEWFRRAKFGMMVHWGLYSLPAGEWRGQRMPLIGEWAQSYFRIPNQEYGRLTGVFNPILSTPRTAAQVCSGFSMIVAAQSTDPIASLALTLFG